MDILWRYAQGVLLGLALAITSSASDAGDDVYPYTDRLIVKFHTTAARDALINSGRTRGGTRIRHTRETANGASVITLTQALTLSAAEDVAADLRTHADVDYAEPDYLMQTLSVPSDPYYGAQWNLFEARGGINAPAAWDITHGASNIVIAVLDTGVVAHEDLAHLLPGYDFVSAARSNDGDGRDADPTDPGDWVTVAENATGPFANCGVKNSSWHGTHVIGTIAAASDNGRGVTGINWVSPILPVRVLGKCGGYTSDIIDAMYWAAGYSIDGVPDNANPARVINLSLGGNATACPRAYQNAIDTLSAAGVAIVVSAGNNARDVSQTAPANCAGVIAVAATDRGGDRAWYSNFGTGVTIAAPGGSQFYYNDPDGILSTLNDGTTGVGIDSYRAYQGTSMSAPHVTGVVSLMLSVNAALSVDQIRSLLQSTARAFPTGSSCIAQCGPGIVNAGAAVAAAKATPGVGFVAITPSYVSSSTNDGSTAQAGGGGGGGCTVAKNGGVDPTLLLLGLVAGLVRTRKRLR